MEKGLKMSWSWKIAKVAGIDLKIHATFLLILAWFGISYYITGGTAAAALTGIFYLLAVFLFVILHELGHALTARKFGIKTLDIILLPIGGLARLEKMPDDPIEEFWVAIAGPAVNFFLAFLLGAGVILTGGLGGLNLANLFSFSSGSMLAQLAFVNLFLGLFNLIPAFPMDGGRILRALLATRLPYTQATRTAARVGQAMAFLLGLVGLFYDPLLIFIAFFIYLGAGSEASSAEAKSALSGVTVSNAMLTEFHTLEEGDPLAHAISLIMSGSQSDFPVLSGGRVVGILTRRGLIKAIERLGERAPVSAAMDCSFEAVGPDDPLESMSTKLQSRECHTLPVLRDGQLVGLITMENIGEYMMIHTALQNSRQSPPDPWPLAR
jgi:Zn-dependent protease/CBS domain-containing protein